jgi:4-amino-4-deoxy-L-arabinose transferase-like glycosyltransferase
VKRTLPTTRAIRLGVFGLAFAALVASASWNLTSWPATWFDEGSHLMVPKALVRYGVYADYDIAGFRYFGPTLGVGPTVLLPVAGVFKLFGVGLLQARLVMATFLVLAVLAFYSLGRRLTDRATALVASALLVTSPVVGTLEWGRQVVGEVPALLFLCLGLTLLISGAREDRTGRLVLAGAILGLAAVTKYQLLGVVIGGLSVAWMFRRLQGGVRLSMFAVPALVAAAVFAVWQVILLQYLGPSSFVDNLRYIREAAGGAALTFSVTRALDNARLILEPGMLLGALVPAVAYGAALAVRKAERTDGWPIVIGLTLAALSWFVLASIGWRRYAYHGLALACIPAAAFIVDGLGLRTRPDVAPAGPVIRVTAGCWLAAMLLFPLLVVVPRIAVRQPREASAMAAALDRQVERSAVIATWEPEMTFLSDHRYKVPPQRLLSVAVAHVYAGGPAPASKYDFMADGPPDFVLEGPFARGVGVYPPELLRAKFDLVEVHGPYSLYRRKQVP